MSDDLQAIRDGIVATYKRATEEAQSLHSTMLYIGQRAETMTHAERIAFLETIREAG